MPRVTDDHRRAQADRFVDAARRCFTRLGVEGTSMEHIRTEAGVSAGLMYRYFASKDAMIRAAISGSMLEFETLIEETDRTATASSATQYLGLLLGSLRQFRHHTEGVDLFALAIQGWAHAQSRPEAAAIVREGFARQLALYRSAAETWAPPDEAGIAAEAIAAAVLGYVVRSAFSDNEIDIAGYCEGLAAFSR